SPKTPQTKPSCFGPPGNPGAERSCLNLNRVEPRTGKHLMTEFNENGNQSFGFTMNLRRNGAEVLRAMVYGVHGGHYRQQYLDSTYIARSLISSDMLFSRLQGKTVARSSGRIFGHSDQTTR